MNARRLAPCAAALALSLLSGCGLSRGIYSNYRPLEELQLVETLGADADEGGVRRSAAAGTDAIHARMGEIAVDFLPDKVTFTLPADGTVLRLSRPLSEVWSVLIRVSPVLWVAVLVLAKHGEEVQKFTDMLLTRLAVATAAGRVRRQIIRKFFKDDERACGVEVKDISVFLAVIVGPVPKHTGILGTESCLHIKRGRPYITKNQYTCPFRNCYSCSQLTN